MLTLNATLRAKYDQVLAEPYDLLATYSPGDRPVRQPVHTLYVPADRYTPDLPYQYGQQALELVEKHGGMRRLADDVLGSSLNAELRQQVADAVVTKLNTEPIEDLRLDFEDGFGHRSDAEEDEWAEKAGRAVAQTWLTGAQESPKVSPTPFAGIRFKCFEQDTRRRALATLDLFLYGLLDEYKKATGSYQIPEMLVLTLPKVSTVAQVEVMVAAAKEIEQAYGLDEGTIKFEVQIETPQVIISQGGAFEVSHVIRAGEGRVTSLHYGTYDYSASCGVAAAYQSMEHPVADFAKDVMQVAIAGTGVHISDGSTNILPIGDEEQVRAAWALHARLVTRHLERGIYQGWDLHYAQLPTRFLATFAFYRKGFAAAATRLDNYVHQKDSAIMDEPATAKSLAAYLQRALSCGAVTGEEIEANAGVTLDQLAHLARTGYMPKVNA